MDAAHFVHQAYLGMVWSPERIFIPTPSGRKRYNVLGALNAVTKDIVTITNDSYINADSVCALIDKLKAERCGRMPITVVLDNAKYQRCKAVIDHAKAADIELLFLPTYSPNLNLIERLWKFVKKKRLYSKYYEKFKEFKISIMECIEAKGDAIMQELKTFLSCNFQSFKNAKISTI